MTRKGHEKNPAVAQGERAGIAVDGSASAVHNKPCLSCLNLDHPHGRSSSFMFEPARQQQSEEDEQGVVGAALSGSDSCAHSCSQSDVEHNRKSFKLLQGPERVESRSGEAQGGSQSTVATAGAVGSGSTARGWVCAPVAAPQSISRRGFNKQQQQQVQGTMNALATQSSFSTGIDQGQAESSSTNLQAQGLPGARKSSNRPLLKELDQVQGAHAQAAATGTAGAKRRRKSADQELADINSANSISATSPANSCDKHIGELHSAAKMMHQGDEVDKYSGTEGQQQLLADDLAMASEPAGAGPGTTSRYSAAASELKCRETMFVSSSNSSNPVTECTNNADADACKSPSPMIFLATPQQQAGSKDCQATHAVQNQRGLSNEGRDECPDDQPAWRRSAAPPTLASTTSCAQDSQGAGMGSGQFPIFDTGAANKRFKADMSSPSHVGNGMVAITAGTGASTSGSRQLLVQHGASSHIPSSDKRPLQDDDHRSSISWLQLGMASSPSRKQVQAEVGRPSHSIMGQETGRGRGEHDAQGGHDRFRPRDMPAEVALNGALWTNVGSSSSTSGPHGQPIRPGVCPPGVATLGPISTESILTADLAIFERPHSGPAGMLHHRPTARNAYGSFMVAENSAFSPPDSRTRLGADQQSRYRVFLEETSVAAGNSKNSDAGPGGAPNFRAGATTDSAAEPLAGVSLGLSMFPPNSLREADPSSRDGHGRLVGNHVAVGSTTQGRHSLQDSQLPVKLDLVSNQAGGAHNKLPNHVMFDHGRMKLQHASEQIINVPRATVPVRSRNSWLPNGMKHDAGGSSGAGLVRSGSLDHAHNLLGMSSNATDQQNAMRGGDASMQSAQAAAAAHNHAWHMVTMQQGGPQFPSSVNMNAYTSSSGMGRTDPNQSRSWEEASRYGRAQASAPDQALFSQSHQAGKPKPDENWQLLMKRAQTMNVNQFQQPATSLMPDMSGRGHSSRSLPPPTSGSLTTMQFLNNVPPAMEPWMAGQRPAQPMMNLPATTASLPAHYIAPSNHMSFQVPAGPWNYKFVPHADINNSVLSHGHPPGAAVANPVRENQFAAVQQNGSDLLASFQHPGRVLYRPPVNAASERSSLVAKRLSDRLHPPGLWFILQAADNKGTHHQGATSKGLYVRIKDGKMPVSYLKRYLVNRLGLQSEAEVEISCKGQPITSNLPLQHVRDSVWFSHMGTDNADLPASNKPDNFSRELLMVLTYHRLQFPQR